MSIRCPLGCVKDAFGDVDKQSSGMRDTINSHLSQAYGVADRKSSDIRDVINTRFADSYKDIKKHWRAILFVGTAGLAGLYFEADRHSVWIRDALNKRFGEAYKDIDKRSSAMRDSINPHLSSAYGVVDSLSSRMRDSINSRFSEMFHSSDKSSTQIRDTTNTHMAQTYGSVDSYSNKMRDAINSRFGQAYGSADSWSSKMRDSINSHISDAFHVVDKMSSQMRDSINGALEAAWHGADRFSKNIRDAINTPIRAVIEFAYDKGIVPVAHYLGGLLHEPDMQKIQPVHFAGGGKIPGSHNRDDVPIYATPGEVVVPLPVVGRFGGADALMSALGFAGTGGAGGHYFGGGIIKDIGSVAGRIGHDVLHPTDLLKDLKGAVLGSLGSVAGPIIHGMEGTADSVLGRMGAFGSYMDRMVHLIGDKFLGFIGGKDDAYNAAQSGGGAGGSPISWNGGSNTIGLIEQLARSLPGGNAMQVTSTYRQGGGSYHAKSEAVDFSNGVDTPAMMLFDQAWAAKFGGSLAELIHAGGTNIKDGRVVDGNGFYGAATMAGHHNHVHVAISPESISRGGQALKAFAGGGGAYPSQGGVSRWRGLVDSTLGELGLSTSLDAKVLRQIATESGGNPNAVQGIRDVNSASGDLARGLMQVIGGTFRANAGPYAGLGVYDPHANIYAGLHYAMGRYGPNLMGLGEGHGYDTGGILPSGGLGVNRSGRPERILSPGQTESFDRLVKLLERGGGQGRGPLVGTVHVHDNVGLDLVLRQAQFREHAGYL